MNITDHCTVHYHYLLKDASGTILQSSRNDQALVYVHGQGALIPGLEKAMAGKKAGDSFNVCVTPEEGFGERSQPLSEKIPIKYLKGGKHWKPGMTAFVETRQGYRQVQIIKAGKFMVEVDLNHPLAGQTLYYEIEIVKVISAGESE